MGSTNNQLNQRREYPRARLVYEHLDFENFPTIRLEVYCLVTVSVVQQKRQGIGMRRERQRLRKGQDGNQEVTIGDVLHCTLVAATSMNALRSERDLKTTTTVVTYCWWW